MTLDPPAAACTYEKSFSIAAPPVRVFEALTKPAHLERWFAEHARVEERVGGMYRFWGRHTPWTADESQADQTITAFDPPSRLAFRWTWRDTACEADLRLQSECEDKTTLHVRMTAGEPRMGFGDECVWYISDLWRFNVGNLRAYLIDGKPALRPDYAAKGDGVDMSIVIAAPPDVVFSALTDPQLMDRWISRKAVVDIAVGGTYSFGWQFGGGAAGEPCGPTTIINLVPNKLLEHDWHYQNEPSTRVRWELQAVPGGTLVRLVHPRRVIEPEFGGYVGGWASYLVELREFASAVSRGDDETWRSPAHTTTAEATVAG